MRVALSVLFALLLAPGADAQQDTSYLDVSIRIFSFEAAAGPAPAEAAAPVSTEEIRQAEARYIPMLLRYRLEATGRFGAVRVLPVIDDGAELRISGSILYSDPHSLQIALQVQDSRNVTWLDKTYTAAAVSSETLSEPTPLDDDFHSLYAAIVNDLLAQLDQLEAEALQEITTVAMLRYGAGLVPEHFRPYLQESPEGILRPRRLPARGDPLLSRIEEVRQREYLFIDVVDEEYGLFFAEVKPVYDMWREFRRGQTQSISDFTARRQDGDSDFRRGTYYALQESYNNYRWVKLQELYLDELREGFANETEAREIELSDSLFRLTGTMEQQYRQWRRILAEMYKLEAGL